MAVKSIETIAGIAVPDTDLIRETTELIRKAENDLLFDHSRRVFVFGALQGRRRGLQPNLELLYVGAMFHDLDADDFGQHFCGNNNAYADIVCECDSTRTAAAAHTAHSTSGSEEPWPDCLPHSALGLQIRAPRRRSTPLAIRGVLFC